MSSRIHEELLQLLRIRGRSTPAQLADGVGVAELSGPLTELVADGLVRNSGNARFPWSLTPEGRELAEMRITGISAAATTRCAEEYERFRELNEQLKQLCADWQNRDPGSASDFGARLTAVDDAAQNLLRPVTRLAPAFAMYGRRLGRARERFLGGAENYLTGVLVDSYHTVWFELHECFFITLGRSRLAESRPVP